MAERNAQQAQQARDELRRVVGYSAARRNYQTRSAKEIWLDNRRRVQASSRQTSLAGG
jgi:hypothetical protein